MVNCWVTTNWFCFEVVEVDQADGDVLAVLAEGHRPLAQQPRGELLVGLDEPVSRRS
jgi:hypothetical protein